MKRVIRRVIGPIVLVALISTAFAPLSGSDGGPKGAVKTRPRGHDRWYLEHRLHVAYRYPEVTGLEDTDLQSRINRALRSAYPPPKGVPAFLKQARGWFKEQSDRPDKKVKQDGDYTVTLNRQHLLSVRFRGEWSSTYGLHPDSTPAAITIDTRSGRVIGWGDLFSGKDWRGRLEGMMARRLTDAGHEDVSTGLQERRYWCYLTPSGAVFFDLGVGGWPGRNLECKFTYGELEALINRKGPLAPLLAR